MRYNCIKCVFEFVSKAREKFWPLPFTTNFKLRRIAAAVPTREISGKRLKKFDKILHPRPHHPAPGLLPGPYGEGCFVMLNA